jgi:predicted Zn-dependent protease with MMP-like domain
MITEVITMSVEQFEELVADALDEIPSELRRAMENVAVLVDDTSPPGGLFGLYEGVPLTSRGNYSSSMPDRITIFMATICNASQTPQDVVKLVHKTVIHEVGHHFGIGEKRLRDLGWG